MPYADPNSPEAKIAARIAQSQWRERNRERERERGRQYNKENSSKVKESQAKHYQNNKEKRKENCRNFYNKNREYRDQYTKDKLKELSPENPRKTNWSKEEIQVIIDNPELTNAQLAFLLQRSYSAVMQRRNKLRKAGLIL